MSEKFYRRMFLVASLWNLIGGVAIILLTDWIFSGIYLKPPQPPAYYQSWIALFMTFGVGYYMVYRSMYTNKNIVVLGIIGKIAFSVIFIGNRLIYSDQIPSVFLIAVVGDLVFVILFWMFLRFANKMGK